MDAGGVDARAVAGRGVPVSDQRAWYDGAADRAEPGRVKRAAYGKIVWSWRPNLASSLAAMRRSNRTAHPTETAGRRWQ